MLAEIAWNEGTIAVAGAFVIPIVAIIATFWYKIARVTSMNELKRRMVQRGMSADEIERVLSAGPLPNDRD